MPAEWEPHEATWIAWPHNEKDWPGRFTPIPWVYAEIVRKLSAVEKVRILVSGESQQRQARTMLKKVGATLEAVEFLECPTDRVWTRDFAPLFLRNKRGEAAASKWRFNGWAKYPNHKLDDAAGHAIAKHTSVETFTPEMVLEGGSIDVNGAGALLTTEECLLSEVQQRNPGMSRREVERNLRNYLGATQVIWLRNGITGDDTHGHVDDLARFVSHDTVVVASEDDKSDVNYEPLRENYALLKQAGLRVIKLPMPRPLVFAGVRLPASYANFYIANGLVIVPTFNDPADRVALGTLTKCFPDRVVTGIDCTALIWGFGALHCMTQQQPAA
jgi:agmatine deiminase